MSATRLVLWRHGVTDWNEQGIFQGRADIPLNERGQAQVVAAAPELVAMHATAVYVSPLIRARQTAQAYVDIAGGQAVVDDRLTEINVGTWVGESLASVRILDPAAGAEMAAGRDYRRSATGETMTEVGVRVADCLRDIADAREGETVLVVSHGGAIRMGIATVLGWPYEASIQLAGMANAAWSIVARWHGDWRLQTYNHVPVDAPPGVNTEI
ncbi:MAG: histidine phosphatase family protein [Propionibacteriaceae bacterium]|nr:histidine phosphatase family protein [Propionibacteriaceae bacterium]